MTEATRKALTILSERINIWPSLFAEKMWPDSPGWKRCINTGPNGATYGKGMWLAAGSYLRRLEKKGLVVSSFRTGQRLYSISSKGQMELEND